MNTKNEIDQIKRVLQKYRFHKDGWGYRQDTITQTVDGVPSVTPPPDDPLVITTTTPLPDGEVGVAYTPYSLTVTGGTGPYVWSVFSGAFIDGLSMDAAGEITGTPTTEGSSLVTVRVTDASNAAKNKTFSIGTGPLTITTTTLPDATLGTPYDEAVVAVGGALPYYWFILSGDLPVGLNLDSGSGHRSGTPAFFAGGFSFVVRVQDGAASPAEQELMITVGV